MKNFKLLLVFFLSTMLFNACTKADDTTYQIKTTPAPIRTT